MKLYIFRTVSVILIDLCDALIWDNVRYLLFQNRVTLEFNNLSKKTTSTELELQALYDKI